MKPTVPTAFAISLVMTAAVAPIVYHVVEKPPVQDLPASDGQLVKLLVKPSYQSAEMAIKVPSSWASNAAVRVKDKTSTLNAFVERQLSSLLFSSDRAARIREVSATLARQVLSSVAENERSVYPAVAPNGAGGVVLFWHADRHEIEVDMDPDLSYYVRVKNGQGVTVFEKEGRAGFPTSEIREHVSALTSYVESRNPDWRATFAA